MIQRMKQRTKHRHSLRLPSPATLMKQRALAERHNHIRDNLVMEGRFDDGRYTPTGWSWMPRRRATYADLRPLTDEQLATGFAQLGGKPVSLTITGYEFGSDPQ